jgi:hypothetical protein
MTKTPDLPDRSEYIAAAIMTALSGGIVGTFYLISNDHDVRQFYAVHHRRIYYVYVVCFFVLWLSFVLNLRYCLKHLPAWLGFV